jgi:molybdopterin-guanine dinucleotide biosynthesis protein A
MSPTNGDRPPTREAAITGLVLCGGAGRRMGGADKPLLHWRGRPLVEHVIERLHGQVDHIVISANRNLERYAVYGPVVTDTMPGFPGPLGGIHATLALCTTPWLLACPGDTPELPLDLADRLLTAALQSSSDRALPARAAIAHDGQRMQPLPLLVHVSQRASIGAYLANGQRSVHGWLERARPAIADFDGEAAAFHGRNTLEDLADGGHSPICDCR